MGKADAATQVCITVDTEFSIGGAFAEPHRRQPIGEQNVLCYGGGEENGLGFLLSTFKAYDISATFFVETLQATYFGERPMGSLVSRIATAGHDLQLHIHPCWMHFRHSDWADRLVHGPPDDNIARHSPADVEEMLELGLDMFRRWDMPSPMAVRTGNLQVSRAIYPTMAAAGFAVSSSVGMGYWPPAEPELRISGGRRRVDGVLEVPVLSYVQFRRLPPSRILTISGSSWAETESLLWQARQHGINPVVLLTHPFEFVKGPRDDPRSARPNRINKNRLARLCSFLAIHKEQFAATTFSEAIPFWLSLPDASADPLASPAGAAMRRIFENKLNDFAKFV